MVTLRDLPDVWIAQPGGGMVQPTAGPYLDIEPDDDTEPTVMPQDVVALLGFDPLQEPIEEDSPSAGIPHVPPVNPTHDAFEETKHPRGQPGNPGQFASGSGGGGAAKSSGGKQYSNPHITHAVAREMAKKPKGHTSEDLIYALSQLKPSHANKMDRAHRKSIVAELATRGIKVSKSKAEGTEPPPDKQIPAAIKEQVKAAEPAKSATPNGVPKPPDGISENVTKILQKADVDKLKNILKAQGVNTPIGQYAKTLLAHYGHPVKEGVDLGAASGGKPEIPSVDKSEATKKVQDIGEGGLSADQKIKILKQMLESNNNSYNTEKHIQSWIEYLEGKGQATEPEPGPKGPVGVAPHVATHMQSQSVEGLKAIIANTGSEPIQNYAKELIKQKETGAPADALADLTKITYTSINNMTKEQLTQYLATTENIHSPVANFAKQKLKEKGGSSAAPPVQPGLTKAQIESSTWKKTGDALGSNEGGTFENDAGDKVYVKLSKTPDHAKNEELAARLYSAMGIVTPRIMTVPADKFGGKQGELATVSSWVEGIKDADMSKPDVKKEVQEHFAVHAWLANWDAVASGNQGWKGNAPVTNDVGGALLYRAKGAPKGMAFGDTVTEWDSMRKDTYKNPQAAAVFGSMTNQQLKDSADFVTQITDEKIKSLVSEYGPGTSDEKEALANKLIKRRDDIKKKMEALSSEPNPPTPTSTPAQVTIPTYTNPPPTKDYGSHSNFVKESGLGTSMEEYRAKLPKKTVTSLQLYSGNVYKEINRAFRDQEVLSDYQQEIVDGIDEYLESDAAKLPKEVEMWRGAKLPPQQIQTLAAALNKPGKKVTLYNHGFSSTTWDKDIAENFCGQQSNSVMMRITVRKGAKVAYMGSGISNLPHEKEMLLPRSVPMRVTKVYKDKNGRYTLEATVG